MKIAVCTVASPCLPVLKASIEAYAKGHELVLSGPGGLPNVGKNFGEAYNNLLCKIFETESECIVANDDVVLRPDTMPLMLTDVATLKASGKKIGWVGARSDHVSGGQNIRTFKSSYCSHHEDDKGVKQVNFIAPIFAYVSREAFTAAPFAMTHWYSDNLSCDEMAAIGYNHFVSRAYVHHVGSSSGKPVGLTVDYKTEAGRWMWPNKPIYAARYGLPKP
jgi:hypothetical protein